MKEANRIRKQEIKYNVDLNEEQRVARNLIRDSQIVIITGRAGSGKSLVSAQCALDYLLKKEADTVYVTRAMVEVGTSMGFLPGDRDEKLNPYLEAFIENLEKCIAKERVSQLIKERSVIGFPVQFVRGKTIDDILVVEEAQNLTKGEMLALLTRLGKTGKIIINGDNEQKDTKHTYTGLDYAIELSKALPGIEYIKLKENHRSDLVGAILDYEYNSR
jgi:phosphate starvation-inducible PhoH-like protein